MASALDLIKRSLRLLGVYSIGEEPSAEEARDALTALSALTDSLANSGLLIYAKTLDTIALTSGTATYTVGPSGATVTARPVDVLDASYISYQGVDYPLSVWTLDDYNSIAVKTVGGTPVGMYPQMDMPNITLSLWPVPSAAMTLKLWSNKALTTFPGLTTTVSLPLGYEQMLTFLLAESLAAEYQVPVPQAVMMEVARVRRNIKRTNVQVPRLQMPYGIPSNDFIDWRGN